MEIFDEVVVLQDLPEQQITKGQVGTIIEARDAATYIVDFSYLSGLSYLKTTISVSLLLRLRHAPNE